MNNAVFRKTMHILLNEKNRDIAFVTTEVRRNYLVPQPKYYTTNHFTKLISHRNEKYRNIHEKVSLFRSINIRKN